MISKIAWKKVMAVICSTALVGTVMCGFGHKVTYAEGTTSEVNGDRGHFLGRQNFMQVRQKTMEMKEHSHGMMNSQQLHLRRQL